MHKAMGFGQPTCLSVSLPPTHPISLTLSVTLSHSLSRTYRHALVHTHLHSRTQSRYISIPTPARMRCISLNPEIAERVKTKWLPSEAFNHHSEHRERERGRERERERDSREREWMTRLKQSYWMENVFGFLWCEQSGSFRQNSICIYHA